MGSVFTGAKRVTPEIVRLSYWGLTALQRVLRVRLSQTTRFPDDMRERTR